MACRVATCLLQSVRGNITAAGCNQINLAQRVPLFDQRSRHQPADSAVCGPVALASSTCNSSKKSRLPATAVPAPAMLDVLRLEHDHRQYRSAMWWLSLPETCGTLSSSFCLRCRLGDVAAIRVWRLSLPATRGAAICHWHSSRSFAKTLLGLPAVR